MVLFSGLTMLVGRQEGHQPVTSPAVGTSEKSYAWKTTVKNREIGSPAIG